MLSADDVGSLLARLNAAEEERDELRGIGIAQSHYEHLCKDLTAERDALKAEVERLRGALVEAREMVEDWGVCATEYFREKHDLTGQLAQLDAAIGEKGGGK